MRMLKRLVPNIYIGLILLFLYLPIAILIVYSFNSVPKSFIWGGFTIRNYTNLFSGSDGGELLEALLTTLKIASVAAVVSTVFGVVSCLGIAYLNKKMQTAIMSLTYIPNVMPELVIGIAFMLLFSFLGVQKGQFTLICAHIAFCVPFAILSINPKIKQLDKNLSEAAMDLGATQWQTLRLVIIPEIMPGIASGFLLSITLSIDDFMISYYNSGDELQNISTYIYSRKQGVPPTIYALSTIIFLCLLVLIVGINIRRIKDKNKKTEVM